VSRRRVRVKRSATVRVLFLGKSGSGAKEDCPKMGLNDDDLGSSGTVGFFF